MGHRETSKLLSYRMNSRISPGQAIDMAMREEESALDIEF